MSSGHLRCDDAITLKLWYKKVLETEYMINITDMFPLLASKTFKALVFAQCQYLTFVIKNFANLFVGKNSAKYILGL